MSTNTKIAALAAALLSATAARAAPAVITYSGFLTDSAGNPVTSPSSLTFRFYAAQGGGNALGSETVSVVPSSEGYFSAVLGTAYSGTVPWSDLFDAQTFMSVQFGSEAEMSPRIQVTSVPSALSVSWDNVTGRPTGVTCPSSLPFVVGEDNGGNPMCAASPAGFSCSSGQVMKWNGSAWQCGDDASGSGTITGITSGTGLTGGGTSGSVAISADFTAVQARVVATCAAGSSIRVINQDGSVTCQVDNTGAGAVTSVAVTAPIVNTGTPTAPVIAMPQAGSAASGFLSSGDWTAFNGKQGRTVAPTCPPSQVLRSIAPDGTPTCATDAIGTGTVTAVKGRWPIGTSNASAPDVYDVFVEPCLTSGEVLKYDVLSGWKCAADLVDGGTAADLACVGCVSGSELAAASVTGGLGGVIADGTIASVDIANAAITSSKLAASSVTSAAIADGTITGADISTAATITATGFAYAAPVTRYVSIPAFAFQPSSDPADDPYVANFVNGSISGGTSPYSTQMFASLEAIPDGATITELQCYWYDNDPTYDVGFDAYLLYHTHPNSFANYYAILTRTQAPSQSTTVQSSTLTTNLSGGTLAEVVDHSQRTYLLRFFHWTQSGPSAAILFYGCRVGYTLSRP